MRNVPKVLFEADATDRAASLRKLSVDVVLWQTTYVDDHTGDVWVMDYPDADRHGGGSPRLTRQDARSPD